jgi:hypothetical protein
MEAGRGLSISDILMLTSERLPDIFAVVWTISQINNEAAMIRIDCIIKNNYHFLWLANSWIVVWPCLSADS